MTATREAGLRPRREADLAELGAILQRVHERHRYPSNLPPDPLPWLAGRPRTFEAFVAESPSGRLLGHVALARAEGDQAEATWLKATGLPGGELAVIKRLFVDPPVAGRGLGAALLQEAVDRSHSLGLRPVLDVDARSRPVHHLYEKAGFSHVGDLELAWSSGGASFLARCYVGPAPAQRAR